MDWTRHHKLKEQDFKDFHNNNNSNLILPSFKICFVISQIGRSEALISINNSEG